MHSEDDGEESQIGSDLGSQSQFSSGARHFQRASVASSAAAAFASSAIGARGTCGLSKGDESDDDETDDDGPASSERRPCYACGVLCKGKCHKKCPSVLQSLIADVEKLSPIDHPDKADILRKMKNPKTSEEKNFRFQKMNEAFDKNGMDRDCQDRRKKMTHFPTYHVVESAGRRSQKQMEAKEYNWAKFKKEVRDHYTEEEYPTALARERWEELLDEADDM